MTTRRQQASDVRRAAADFAESRPHPQHVANGEEYAYRDAANVPTYLGNFTKGLPHCEDGLLEVQPEDSYSLFVLGIQSGADRDFRRTPLGPPRFDEKPRSEIWASDMAQSAADGAGANVRAWESSAAGLAFDLEGPDAQAVTMPPAPRLDDDELVAEMAEVYLMALLRDVPFLEFEGSPSSSSGGPVDKAIDLLNALAWFRPSLRAELDGAPRLRHRSGFNRQNVFRGIAPGDDVGPYISQFLLVGNTHLGEDTHALADGFVQYGAQRIDQRVRVATEGVDYMTTFEQWLDVQNGADLRGLETYVSAANGPMGKPVKRKGKKKAAPKKGMPEAAEFRFIATPRDLSTYVHYDALYQAYLNACLTMIGLGIPFDRGLPFRAPDELDHQQGFAHFGGPHILSLVTEVATRALKAVRYQKFNVHRRARPEALAGLVHLFKHALGKGGSLEDERLAPVTKLVKDLDATRFGSRSSLLDAVVAHNRTQNELPDRSCDPRAAEDSYLLPMAFPEGSPMHPSYGAGHATVAGACVTILKAFFDHGHTLDGLGGVYRASADGSRLESTTDTTLTVEGELNKLAANIAIGRDWAGVHYFTDYIESLRMGEAIAIGVLEEQRLTYGENFSMTVPLYDGGTVRI